MPSVPTPPASTWENYPEVAIIVIVALLFIAAFVYYNERREKVWLTFWAEQRQAFLQTLSEYRDSDRAALTDLVDEIRCIREDHKAHDQRMQVAIATMHERTRPIDDGRPGRKPRKATE